VTPFGEGGIVEPPDQPGTSGSAGRGATEAAVPPAEVARQRRKGPSPGAAWTNARFAGAGNWPPSSLTPLLEPLLLPPWWPPLDPLLDPETPLLLPETPPLLLLALLEL